MATFNPFRGLKDAQVTKRGSYFPPDFKGLVEILDVKLVESKEKNTMYYIIETKVVESNLDELEEGDERSVMYDFAHGKTALGNIKGFLAPALRLPIDEIDDDMGLGSVEHEKDGVTIPSPFRGLGVLMRLVTKQIKTKKKNENFTVHEWSAGE